jgi:hypothetical protein
MKGYYGCFNCPACRAKASNQGALTRHVERKARHDPVHQVLLDRLYSLKGVK